MKPYRSRRRRGFTLIEVLMVLVILVIIASLAYSSYSSAQKTAKIRAAIAQIGLFKTPLDLFNMDLNYYPTTLDALQNPPTDLVNLGSWNGPYFDAQIPLDPWQRPYNYLSPGKYNINSFDLWSVGPDGIDGTEDDIGNWSTGR